MQQGSGHGGGDGGERKALSAFALKSRLTVFIVTLVSAVIVLVVVVTGPLYTHLVDTAREDLAWRTLRGAGELARACDLGIISRRSQLLREAFEPFARSEDVMALVALDARGGIVARHGTPPADLALILAQPPDILLETPTSFRSWSRAEIEGERVGSVVVEVSKRRLEEGRRLQVRLVTLAAVGAAGALAVSLFFVGTYLGPLLRFTDDTLERLRLLNATLEQRVDEKTRALSDANVELEHSLARLNEAQRALVDASRRAGMAEVATSVLHNVGNVLTSANTATGMAFELVREVRVDNLDLALGLFDESRGRWPEFFASDPRAPRVVELMALMRDHMKSVCTRLVAELAEIHKSLDHMKHLVSRQQEHAAAPIGIFEVANPCDIVDAALENQRSALESAGVKVERAYDAVPPTLLDRHRLLEIVINLVANAVHAVRKSPDPRIRVRVAAASDSRLMIVVEDNGYGIAAEDLARVFSRGFTTKAEGHGFGLHASALAARDMGGALSAHSAGANQGAAFRLEFPTSPAGASA